MAIADRRAFRTAQQPCVGGGACASGSICDTLRSPERRRYRRLTGNTEKMMGHEEKVVQWFNAVDWIQAGSRIAAILVVSFLLVYIARRLISGLEKFTATHAHDVEAQKRAATVSNVLRKLATILITGIAL